MSAMKQIITKVDAAQDSLKENSNSALTHIETAMLLADPSLKATPWIPNRSRLSQAGDLLHLSVAWRLLRARALMDLGHFEEAYTVTLWVFPVVNLQGTLNKSLIPTVPF